MKIKLLFFSSMMSILSFAQSPCGFDQRQSILESLHPEVKAARQKAKKALPLLHEHGLQKLAAQNQDMNTTVVYEIPVVVHVIESSDPTNASYTITDAQIQAAIDNTNKIYATTYGNGFYGEGAGVDGGTVLPFKFVLAKRSPDCKSTTGIVRYNGSTLTGYDQYGVKFNASNGVTTDQINQLAPHWPEAYYYNVYVEIALDGVKAANGMLGAATYPYNPDEYFECHLKASALKMTNSTTMAHEFGHALGLLHPFDNGGDALTCPSNNDCSFDNDEVCDTEPTKMLGSVYPVPSNSDINPCTTVAYQGGQYNIMNYSYAPRKFTPGQRDKMIATMLQYRESLLNSPAGKELTEVVAASAACIPSGIVSRTDNNVGPTSVTLGTIDNASYGYTSYTPDYYVDYTTQACLNTKLYTDLQLASAQTLSVAIEPPKSQVIKAWIDYNNNGVFESSELIADSKTLVNPSASVFSASFTPPSTAVLNTYLRMRVRSDITSLASCDNPYFGQVEDYAVRIVSSTNDNVIKADTQYEAFYEANANKLILNSKQSSYFGNYSITDVTGKTVQRGNCNNTEIIVNEALRKGVYMLHFKGDSNRLKVVKFIK